MRLDCLYLLTFLAEYDKLMQIDGSHPEKEEYYMIRRNAIGLAVCALSLGVLLDMSPAHGQASFTIRRPKDGLTVKETQRVEIPSASIPAGGFIGFYIDDVFVVALAPPEAQEGGDQSKPFSYSWDTKGTDVSDGEHTLTAVLFTPLTGTGTGDTVTETGRSSVKVTVANKIQDGPKSIFLKYRYHEGDSLEYDRNGKLILVASGSLNGKSNDTDLASLRSVLQLAVEDSRYDKSRNDTIYLLRNKLTKLAVLNGGQETVFDASQLSTSMYQEMQPSGLVSYETGALAGLGEFTALGLPVNNTLELPLLSSNEVSVGTEWTTSGQRLDIPGLPPALQPKVNLKNKLIDLEWEGGRKTAKIHQTYSGAIKTKSVLVGGVEVDNPKVEFSRDIFIAYGSGQLVRMNRQITITGTTTSPLPEAGATFGGGGGGNAFGGAPAGGGQEGFGASGGGGGIPPQYAQFARGQQGGGFGGKQGQSSSAGQSQGGIPPQYAQFARGQQGRGAPAQSSGSGGSFQGNGGGFPGAGGDTNAPHAITLRSTTETTLLPSSSIGSGVVKASFKRVSGKKGRGR